MTAAAERLDEARTRQRSGADPANSAFVMANAGSGKTRVLIERVARMLLQRVDPQQILCITFTKAAAAEMSERLFETLGQWALADDAELRGRLSEIEGAAAPERSAAALSEVRRLFARALETPGGLKIQTIHAFCESMLKRFPLEAGVPPGFSVIEEGESRRMLTDAIDGLASDADGAPAVQRDIARLSRNAAEAELRALLTRGAGSGLQYNAMLERYDGFDGVLSALADALGVDASCSEEDIVNDFLSAIDPEKMNAAREALLEGGKNVKDRNAKPIGAYLDAGDNDARWTALRKLFLKTDGAPRGRYGDKKIHDAHAWLAPFLLDLEDRFVAADERRKSASIFADSAAYFRLIAALRDRYEASKAANAALDFDDLIMCARRLLQTEAAAWVRYKLDFGIDHILVDETQDTSPEQWSVIRALVDDYLSGAGARSVNRTFFAVGDVKQSIYSFQGADAEVFEEQETDLGKALAAYHGRVGGDYATIDMQMSFRTTAPVLAFVDQVFSDEEARIGLGKDGAPPHLVNRVGEAGLVEVWPLTPKRDIERANAWDAPVDAPAPDHPAQRLCRRVAETIDQWLTRREMLSSQGRRVRPDDILILVQSRGPLFDGVLRALAMHGVPVAGADRLKLLEDPAVEDLLSYMKFCVQPRDDLSLAETLKSPLFDFDDDGDLFPLAHERGDEESLWDSLGRRAGEREPWRDALERLAEARSVALAGGAYAFLAHVLETRLAKGHASGRRLFNGRLSKASRDGVDEMLRQALVFERAHPRSTRAFIGWFEENAAEIKRELERSDSAVRVMTVHGAKGLEANIVFLIDAHRDPPMKNIGAPLELLGAGDAALRTGRLRAIVGGGTRDSAITAAARSRVRARHFEEYRRLFYVAATRARDRLYIAGVESGRGGDPRARPIVEKSWHALAMDAFDAMGARVETDPAPFWPESDAPLRRLTCAQTADIAADTTAAERPDVEVPSWMMQIAAPDPAPPRLSPSRLAEEEEAESETVPPSGPAYSPVARDRYFRGRILHRLLELLPEVDLPMRAVAADRLLARLASEIDETERVRWRDECLAVLDAPQFARVFAPGSRAEVAVAGEVGGRIVSGQIDRLIVGDGEILIVDYKTNRPPPARVADTAPAYLAQMAAYRALLQKIYPGHQVECALLWTFAPRLTPLPKLLLDEAYARWVAAG